MSFALLGVMAMQLYFLRQSYQMQSELFDRSVNEALNNVAAKVSKRDAVNFLNVKARQKQYSPAAANDPNTVKDIDDHNTAVHPTKTTNRPPKKDCFAAR